MRDVGGKQRGEELRQEVSADYPANSVKRVGEKGVGDEGTSRIFRENSQEQHGTMSTVLRERHNAEVDSRENRTTDNAEIYIVNRVHCSETFVGPTVLPGIYLFIDMRNDLHIDPTLKRATVIGLTQPTQRNQ